MRHFFPVMTACLIVLASGCGQPQPTMAGGKPVGHWLKALQDPDPKMRKVAITKLGNIGPADSAVLPAVIGALKDPDATVRCAALLALLKCGPAANDAIPMLMDMQQKDRNAQVRSYAAQALARLQEVK